MSKAECSLVQQNYYLFDYYDELLKDIGLIMDIDFGKRIRTLGEIKKILAKTKKQKKHHEKNDKTEKPQSSINTWIAAIFNLLYLQKSG